MPTEDDGSPPHPGEPDLARFVRGELPPAEARAVVRHLLARCPRCARVARRLWQLADPKPGFSTEGNAMTERETAVREKLRQIAGELDALQGRLRELAAQLGGEPPPAGETEDAMEGATDAATDAATELRAVIECVLIDRLQPALRDLQRVSRG